MKFCFYKIIFFFLFVNVSYSSDTIRFVDINYLVNNSKIGVSLNKIIENKNNKTLNELDKIKNALDEKKK